MLTGNMTASRVRVSHVGIAVPSIDAALPFYRDVLGLEPGHPETADGATIVPLALGDVHVELLEPRDPDGPVARFLAKRGPGLHHVAYRVGDIEATLNSLAEAGLRLIDERPRVGIRNSRVAFLHPASTGGVLTEIVQPAEGGH